MAERESRDNDGRTRKEVGCGESAGAEGVRRLTAGVRLGLLSGLRHAREPPPPIRGGVDSSCSLCPVTLPDGGEMEQVGWHRTMIIYVYYFFTSVDREQLE